MYKIVCKMTTINFIVSVVLVFNILMCSGLRSSARDKKAKCPTCSDIVEAFKKGKLNTEKANFGGGNTAWEERKLGSYATSETRLVEILEGLCDDGASECHAMVEEQEETLEEWWFKHQFKVSDMKTWLCIENIKVCCPNGTYGPDCGECPGGPETPCNGHGSCGGDGTREGSGECSCDSEYEGELCDDCADGYFEEKDEDSKPKCTACHISCDDDCTGSSPKDCEKCKEGWEMKEEEGCTDKNECDEEDKCEGGKYCVNNPGSYSCQACDDSCEGNCTGEGSKSCVECASGYTMSDEDGCKDDDECAANATICESGKFCDNTPGSYSCRACHLACETCIGEGSRGCTKCTVGYKMVESECKDVDECASDEQLCDQETEKCTNTDGSFTCECRKGFKREGDTCVKNKQEVLEDDEDDDDGDDEEEEKEEEESKSDSDQSKEEL